MYDFGLYRLMMILCKRTPISPTQQKRRYSPHEIL